MTATFINSFILFFVAIDTIGNVPFFLSLTEDVKVKERNQIAIKSTIIAFFILITFAYVGRYLLEAIGVSLDSLKIAGGVILMLLAIDILFEKRKKRREKRVEEALDEKSFDEIAVFPIAIPFIAGPSALTTIILLIGNYKNFPDEINISYKSDVSYIWKGGFKSDDKLEKEGKLNYISLTVNPDWSRKWRSSDPDYQKKLSDFMVENEVSVFGKKKKKKKKKRK